MPKKKRRAGVGQAREGGRKSKYTPVADDKRKRKKPGPGPGPDPDPGPGPSPGQGSLPVAAGSVIVPTAASASVHQAHHQSR